MSAPKVFTYDSARINYFVSDTYGQITATAGTTEDFGNISDAPVIEEDALGFNPNNYGIITFVGDVYPFGEIATITNGLEESATFVPSIPMDPVLIQGLGKVSRSQAPWQGSGTLFEIGGGLERLVIPDFGAAGPFPTLLGEAHTSNTFVEIGSGTLTVSEEAATAEFNIYPFESRITLTVSGGTSQTYPDEFIEIRPNEETLNGTLEESRTYDYSFYTGGFEELDFGTVVIRQGAAFSSDDVTFDSTQNNTNSFADADQVTSEAFGDISQTPASYEDWGQIVADVRYGKLSTKATSVNAQNKAYDRFIRDYVGETAQLVKQSGLSERNTFAWEGSGTITAQGQLGLGQAPQHTVFGEEGQFTFNGSANESFTPKGIEGTGLIVKGSAAAEAVVRQRISRAELFFTGFAEGLKLTHFPPSTTARHTLTGAATDVAIVKDYENTNLFAISGTIIEDFTPHWRSPLERDGFVEPIDYGSISQTPTQDDTDYGFVRLVAFRAEDYKYIIPGFRAVTIVGEGDQAFARTSYNGIGTFFLSDFADAPRAYDYESSGITGIATYKAGINIFGYNWFSQAPQHTVFGLEGEFTISGTGSESITPATEIGSGSLFTIGGISESVTKASDTAVTKFLTGSSESRFVPHVSGSGLITLRQGREEGQTYLRIIDVGETVGLFGITGSSIERQTDSYNESSILYGQGNEAWGEISNLNVSRGFDVSIGSTTLPSFDNTNAIGNFSSSVVSEDWGEIGRSVVGGPPYDQYEWPSNTGFIHQDNIDRGYFDYGWLNEDSERPPIFPLTSGTAVGVIDAEPRAKTQWIPSFPGSGTVLFDISSATESITIFERADVPLLPLSGSGDEAVVWQSPERTVTILTSGFGTESLTKVDVGIGTASFSGELVEKVRFEEIGSGTISLVGIGSEKLISNPPEGTSLFTPYGTVDPLRAAYAEVADKATLRLSGELVHPDIDYTPHYGIDRNIGIETGFTLSSGGGLNEEGTGPGIVTTRFIPKYPATGTIFIDGKAIGRTNAPILTDGTIYILGIGTEGNGVIDDDTGIGDLNGVEFGAKERFIPAPIIAGPVLFNFVGSAPNRPISVFGYYGDDRDPGTSGSITISTEKDQTLYREITQAPVGVGIGTFSGTLDFRKTNSFDGSGSLYTIGGAAESTLVRPVGAGTLFISGPYGAAEAYSAQTPENTATLTISGDADAFRQRKYVGSGTLHVSGIAEERNTFSEVGGGSLFAFASGAESITPVISTFAVLVNVGGESENRQIQVFGYYGDDKDPGTSGTISIVGELTHPQIDYTPAPDGSGLFNFTGESTSVYRITAIIIGGTATISGSADVSFTSSAGEETMLFKILGDADEKPIQVFGYYGDDKDPGTSGITTVSGVGITKPIQVFGYYGDDRDPGTSGKLQLSSTTLVHPFVDFTPSPDGSGLFKIGGGVGFRRVFPPFNATGSLFGIGSLDEAYARSTYVGIGNITIESITPTIVELVQFEEGRTFVVII
jgi:hypothetical protein